MRVPSSLFQVMVYERRLAVNVAVYVASPVTKAISGDQPLNE